MRCNSFVYENKLDNEPTEYMEVTPVTSDGNGMGCWRNTVEDAEILAVGTGGTYNVHGPPTGETVEVGVTGAVVQTKLIEYRQAYAQQNEVNTKRSVTESSPTNTDMSGYITP